MPLRIEFLEESLDEEEVNAFLVANRFRLHEVIKRQPNGRLGVFVGWATLPNYVDQAPAFPKEWDAMYYFTDKLYKVDLKQGLYDYGDVGLVVQLEKDKDLNELYYEVEVKGHDLAKVSHAYIHFRSGKLMPSSDWSSSGAIEAPKAEIDSSDGEEGSGQLNLLPSMAAKEKTKAA